jgi:Transcriptional regulator C-terminal region
VARVLRESVSGLVQEHFRSQFPNAPGNRTQREATMQFVTGACMGLLIWWLEDDDVPYTAEEIHSVFRGLATQGVRRFLTTT